MSNRDVERGEGSGDADSTGANEARWVLSIHFERFASGGEWRPWLTLVFCFANAAAFATAFYFTLCLGSEVESWWSISPSLLDKMGALEWYKTVYQKQAWRMITSMWLHADFVHLLSTNLTLVLFCLSLEQRFGFVRFGKIYLLFGVGASILSLLFVQEGMAFGASGAIFGVFGAKISEFITNWTLRANKGARLSILMCSSALSLGFVVLCSYMDNFGHVGGLLTGFLLGFVLLVRPWHEWASRQDSSDNAHANEPKYKMYQYALCLLSLVPLITGFTVGLVMLYKGETPVVITEQVGFRRG